MIKNSNKARLAKIDPSVLGACGEEVDCSLSKLVLALQKVLKKLSPELPWVMRSKYLFNSLQVEGPKPVS